MPAFILTLCGFLPFPLLMLLEACGTLDLWTHDVTEKLAWGYLCFLGGLLLMLVAAVLAIVGICRRRQKRWNITALLLMLAWPLVCGVLQMLVFG